MLRINSSQHPLLHTNSINLNPRFADLLVERKIKMKMFSFYPQIGNALVCLAVYTNHSMRTVTNIFIVNLAVADFFVILLCLPPTVVWDVTETWFLGEVLCKVVIYFQVGRKASRLSSVAVIGLVLNMLIVLFTRVFVYLRKSDPAARYHLPKQTSTSEGKL